MVSSVNSLYSHSVFHEDISIRVVIFRRENTKNNPFWNGLSESAIQNSTVFSITVL